MKLPVSDGAAESKYKSLPDGMDFLLYPVSQGLCKYESLKDGSLTLEDVLIMNWHLRNVAYNRDLAQREAMNNGKHS